LCGVSWLKLAEVSGRPVGPIIWVQAECQAKVLWMNIQVETTFTRHFSRAKKMREIRLTETAVNFNIVTPRNSSDAPDFNIFRGESLKYSDFV
jgi:hypothetical protein